MKKIVKLLVLVVVVVAVIGGGITIYNRVADSPRSTIQNFEDSYNNKDIDGMIECMEPDVQSIYSGANSLMSTFLGMDISDLASMLPFMEAVDEDADSSDFPTMDIDITDIVKTSDTTATVYCDITYTSSDSEETKQGEEIECVKENDVWYICA